MDMSKESWMEKMLISLNYLIQLYLDATIAIKSDIKCAFQSEARFF